MTRRGFIKRTAATAMAVVLALHAFESEAVAADAGGSSGEYLLELSGWPEANITYTAPDGHQEVEFGDIDQITAPANSNGYTWSVTSRARVSPNAIASTKQADDEFHFMDTSFGVTITVAIRVYQGATLVYQNTITSSGSLSASLADPVKGLVSGSASNNSSANGTYRSTIGGQEYGIHISSTAADGNPDPLSTSVSPMVGLYISVYEIGTGSGGGDTTILAAPNSVSFTWNSFWVPK
jgi:hypothetical protein